MTLSEGFITVSERLFVILGALLNVVSGLIKLDFTDICPVSCRLRRRQ